MAFSIGGMGVSGKSVLMAAYLFMNMAGLIVMGNDKNRAKKHQYRIRERTLWLVALFGGAVGATIGMELFRHKTKHIAFKVGFPVLALMEIMIFIYYLI